jgi:ELWxxDGT repeat protein
VLFNGRDSSGLQNLWVTDGTIAGTSELSIPGIAALAPSDFSMFGSAALFQGADPAGGRVLWVTDGTIGGTSELSIAAYSSGLQPGGFAALGSEVLFAGAYPGLWATNGCSWNVGA